MKSILIGAFTASTLVLASAARAAAPQLSELLDKVSAGAPVRLDASEAVKMPAAVPGRTIPSTRASRASDAWAKLIAQAERKQSKSLEIDESRETGMTKSTLEVRIGMDGVKVVVLETSDLLMVGDSYIDTVSDYTTDAKGEELLNARAYILGHASGDGPHDPLGGDVDVNNPSVRKGFADEIAYWIKNFRKAE